MAVNKTASVPISAYLKPLNQFSEVNVIMPALAKVQDAIPATLHLKYIDMLIAQSNSSSFQGAPAARLALTSLSDAAVASLIDKLSIEWFKGQPIDANKLLRNLFASHINQVPDDKRELVQSFIDNGYFEFLEMHGQLEQE